MNKLPHSVIVNPLADFLAEEGLKIFNPFQETLYKYVSVETAKSILKNSSLKFSSPLEFNDPFELTLDSYDFEMDRDDLKALIERAVPGSKKDRKRFYHKNKQNRARAVKGVKIGLEELKKSIGICCFSSQYEKTLMWSHYGNSHKGVCLGFRSFTSSHNFFILHVRYLSEIPTIKYWKLRERMFPLWVFTKSHVWEYEEEVRAVHTERNGLLSFDKKCLVEVIYGLRTPESDIFEIDDLLKSKEYTAKKSKMTINPSTFDIVKVASVPEKKLP